MTKIDLTGFLAPPSSTSGEQTTKLKTHEELGRTVVTKTACDSIGEVIIRERPLLIWQAKDGHCDEPLQAFLKAPEHAREIILDMFTPPPDSSLMLQAASNAMIISASYPREASLIGRATLTKLIGVEMTNAHAYYGHAGHSYIEYIGTGNSGDGAKSALFAYRSKVAHSCLPNVSYTSKSDDGCLQYKVIRPIAKEEMVTFSYIGGLFSTPTFLRRQSLWVSKSFFCKCQRCMEPDQCRLMPCPTPKCTSFARCVYENSTASSLRESPQCPVTPIDHWTCQGCGILDKCVNSTLARKEATIQSKIEFIELKLATPHGLQKVFPAELEELLGLAKTELSRLHYLKLKVFQMITQICASHSVGIEKATTLEMLRPNEKTAYGTATQLRRRAAMAGFEFVSACECVAAGCLSGCCAVATHPPIYECVVEILHAWEDLKHVPQSRWPTETNGAYLTRYLPLFYMNYGEQDSDAKDIKEHLRTLTKNTILEKPSSCCDFCKIESEAHNMQCGRCKNVCYCSKECQVAGWRAGHKMVCLKK